MIATGSTVLPADHCLPHTEHHCSLLCRSLALLEGLGWSKPLPGFTIAAQLLALGRLHPAVPESAVAANNTRERNSPGAELDSASGDAEGPHSASTAVSQMLAQLIPQLYRALNALSADDLKSAAGVVSGAAVVWVGNGFAQTDRVALRCEIMIMSCGMTYCCILCMLQHQSTRLKYICVRAVFIICKH